MQNKQFSLAALGGTFDHFHIGHQLLIATAGKQSDHLMIGITTDEYASQHKVMPEVLESFAVRAQTVWEFCKKNHIAHTIVELRNSLGSAATDVEMQALFYTSDVQKNAKKINKYRSEHDLPELSLVEVPLLKTKEGQKISSELIREGKIDRNGTILNAVFSKNITLTAKQKKVLTQPLGSILNGEPPQSVGQKIIVGDSTLEQFQDNHWPFDMAVIDGKKQREEYSPLAIDTTMIDLVLVNPPSQISTMLVAGLQLALRKHLDYVYIDGEEDLAAIALILLAPLGTAVYYGQPNLGVIEWVATEQTKAFAYDLLHKTA